MQIVVAFTGPLRDQGPATLDVPEGTTLAAVCRQLGAHASADVRRHLLTAEGGLEPTLLVAVNGEGVAFAERAGRILADGDELLLMPPIAGG